MVLVKHINVNMDFKRFFIPSCSCCVSTFTFIKLKFVMTRLLHSHNFCRNFIYLRYGLENRPEIVGMIKCSSRTNVFWHIWNFFSFAKKKVKYVFVLHQALSHDGELETVKIEINFMMMIFWQLLQKLHIISLYVSLFLSPVTPSWCVFVSLTFHD